MIMTHPEHGNMDVCFSDQVDALEKKGWVKAGSKKPEQESLESVRARWEKKFGVKPHHLKKIENLLRELGDDRT